MGLEHVVFKETLLCAAVGTTSQQHMG